MGGNLLASLQAIQQVRLRESRPVRVGSFGLLQVHSNMQLLGTLLKVLHVCMPVLFVVCKLVQHAPCNDQGHILNIL